MRDVFVARQPIFDRNQNIRAYEVLFRNSAENRAIITDGDRATSELLFNAFVTIGLDRIVGDNAAFINLTRDFLIGRRPLPASSDRLVLEILEDITIDDELVAGVRNLVDQGYTLALDDVVFEERLAPLVEMARIIKVNLPSVPQSEWKEQVRRFRSVSRAEILAEKVETQAEFDLGREAGFDLFQGYFFSRPQMLTSRELPSSQLSILRLISELNRPDVTIQDLERILKIDADLSFKLLRFINSARCGVPRRVESLHQAINFLGIRGVRSLTLMVSTSSLSCDRPETLKNAILRAILCEKLGRLISGCDPNACYTAGLVSALDAVLEVSLEEILKLLPLSDVIQNAVTTRGGTLGEIVRCAEAHETVEGPHFSTLPLTGEQTRTAFFEAISDVQTIFA